jgi:hypothetical protein
MVAVQSSVGWARRGLVTGTSMFSRSLGSAVGVAAFGALVTAVTVARVPRGADPARLALASDTAPDVARAVRAALADATHDVFVVLAAVALLTVLALLLMPRRQEAQPEGQEDRLPLEASGERGSSA